MPKTQVGYLPEKDLSNFKVRIFDDNKINDWHLAIWNYGRSIGRIVQSPEFKGSMIQEVTLKAYLEKSGPLAAIEVKNKKLYAYGNPKYSPAEILRAAALHQSLFLLEDLNLLMVDLKQDERLERLTENLGKRWTVVLFVDKYVSNPTSDLRTIHVGVPYPNDPDATACCTAHFVINPANFDTYLESVKSAKLDPERKKFTFGYWANTTEFNKSKEQQENGFTQLLSEINRFCASESAIVSVTPESDSDSSSEGSSSDEGTSDVLNGSATPSRKKRRIGTTEDEKSEERGNRVPVHVLPSER